MATKKSNKLMLFMSLKIVLLLSCPFTTSAAQVKAAYWSQDAGFPASSIDSTLFTHLFCAFATIDSSTYQVSAPAPASFSQFTSTVRAKNPSIKTLVSIGGGGGGNIATVFAAMASAPASRKTFIDSSISFARSNSFDGLDLDYEIPASATDMSNLGVLLSEWRAALDAESSSSSKPRLLLTAAVRYTNTNYYATADPYPAASIASNLDWINVMAYDLTAPASWGSPDKTGATAPLYDPTGQASGSSGVDAWVAAGVPKSQIVLGIPFYGYAWKLTDASNHGYGAPAAGPATAADGAMTYSAIRDFVRNNAGAVKVYDQSRRANYCYQGTTWISYDDVEAVAAKADYVSKNGLLGYFAWRIGGDDSAFTLSNTAARY